jgi:TetR/AcrR family transcriptional regulator, cholesterol catabolism regulator
MRSTSQAPAPPARVARRRAATRDRIVATAARQFAESGPGAVRMDEVAEAADVARGTLYSHFPTKDALLCAIVEPVLRLAVRRATALVRLDAREGLDRLLALYLELWRTHPDALRIAYKAQDMPLGNVATLHRDFLRGLLRVFERANGSGILRSGDPVLAGHVMRQIAVPLLELCARHRDGDRLFVDGLRGLLLKDERQEPSAGGRRPPAGVSSRRPRGASGRAS